MKIFEDFGLIEPASLVDDGNIYRIGTIKKPRSKNGWYIAYPEGVIVGNWEYGDDSGFHRYDGVSDIDFRRFQLRAEQLKLDREIEREHKADEAASFVESCAQDGFSDYLKRKRAYPHGARFDGKTLIIPLQDAQGKIWSYQRINADGSKFFMPGGRTQGCYFLIAGRNVSKDERVVVCEGFATGAAIHQETGLPVIVAFNAANLKPVCDAVVFTNIVIAADNDASGVGEKYASQSGYSYVMPDVEGWDFSDLFLAGKDVKSYFIQTTEAIRQTKVHGLVGEIADWITSTAIRPQPMLSIAAALAFVGMLRGHRIAGKTDLRTNLLVMSLAPTAAGKEHPQACIKRLIAACALDKHLMGEPVSGGGFLTGLNKGGRVSLLIQDEMGRYMQNLSGKQSGTHQREIVDYIIKTFSNANSVLKGRQYVDEKKNPTIDVIQPHFCCLGSTVQERLQQACGSSEIIDGFLNRWLVFNVKERTPRQENVSFSMPSDDLIERIKALADKAGVYNSYGEPQPKTVKFTPEAWDIFSAYREKIDKVIEQSSYPMDRLYSRTVEHTEKVALTLCDGDDIMVQDVQAAIHIVNQSNASIMEFAGLIADNIHEQDYIRVREIIKEAKDIKRSVLTRRCQFIQGGARRLGEIIGVLLDENIIAERKDSNRTYYKWIG